MSPLAAFASRAFPIRTPSRPAAGTQQRNIRAGPELQARGSCPALLRPSARRTRPVTDLSLRGSIRPRAETEVLIRKPRLNTKRQALVAERAHAMRHAPTPSEAVLWRLLSARKLGVSFRRQVLLGGRYIADFLAPSAHLILEVDGNSHRGRTQAEARRDRVLTRLGYRVLRLEAGLVLRHPALAVARIQAALAND